MSAKYELREGKTAGVRQELITIKHQANMKKTYLPPETEILSLVTESTFICASFDSPKSDSWDLIVDDVTDEGDYWSIN